MARTSTEDAIQLIDGITRRPEMYVSGPRGTYDAVATWLHGYDAAHGRSFLEGLNEWLCVKYDKEYNVHWDVIIAIELLGDARIEERSRSEQEDASLLSSLRSTLTDYLRHRDRIGLRNVLYDHGQWMRQKPWFDENVERFGCSSGPTPDASHDG